MVDIKVETLNEGLPNEIQVEAVYGPAGKDGATPEIGENGNWWINGEDTGKPSRGEAGSAADLTNYYNKQEVDGLIQPVSENATEALGLAEEQAEKIGTIETSLAGKQDKLIAGENISIQDNTISSSIPIASANILGAVKIGTGLAVTEDGTLSAIGGASGTTDYSELTNKPQINSVELSGNKTLAELGIQAAGDYALSSDIPATTSELSNDSGFITKDVNNLTNYTLSSGLSAVATSGSYEDLTNKPDIPEAYVLPTASTSQLGGVKVDGSTITISDGTISAVGGGSSGTTDYTALTNKPQINNIELDGNKSLADLGIQAAGDYLVQSDLSTYALKSELPENTSDLNNDSGFITSSALSGYAQTSSLATVATSGSYNDLSNKPTIPEAYTLPVASDSTLGGVKLGDPTIKLADDTDMIYVPYATGSSHGVVQPDGETITVSGGVISATMSNLPVASNTTLGAVKVDNSTITATADGTISASGAAKGSNFYIYGNSGVPAIKPSASTTIPVTRFHNYDDYGCKLQLGDVLIDLEGNIAYVTNLNSGPSNPNQWTFNVTEESIVVRLQTKSSEDLTTTDKTIVGAINELEAGKSDKDTPIEEISDLTSLQSNHVYKISISTEQTVTYPTVSNNSISNSVVIYAHVTAAVSINWGSDVYFYNKKIPTIGVGDYDIVLMYNPNVQKWCVSCVEVGAAS